MPIEIRELVIRAAVEERKENSQSSGRESSGHRNEYNRMMNEFREIKKMITEKKER